MLELLTREDPPVDGLEIRMSEVTTVEEMSLLILELELRAAGVKLLDDMVVFKKA